MDNFFVYSVLVQKLAFMDFYLLLFPLFLYTFKNSFCFVAIGLMKEA